MRRTLFLITLCVTTSILAQGETTPKQIDHVRSEHHQRIARCRGDQLSVRHLNDDAAMGGVRSVDYSITNDSASPCTLKGHPRFELLNRRGSVLRRGIRSNQLMSDSERMAPQLVTIEPGKTAWFRIHFNAGGAGHMGRPCPTYSRVKIIAPGTTRAHVLREDITSCRGSNIDVSAVRSGLPEHGGN